MKSADRPPCILSFYRFTEATARLVRVQRLKLMWDYRCWPPWLDDSLEPERPARNIAPADLPISSETAAQLLAWAAIPDAKLDEHLEGPQDITWTEEEAHSFEEEGRVLWARLQHEPGDEYHVVYFSSSLGRVLEPGQAD